MKDQEYRKLPQLCCRCFNRDIGGKLKVAEGGRFFRSSKFGRKPVWVCLTCLRKPVRRYRAGQETPPEREVRTALMVFGEHFIPEYKSGWYIFDFACPSIRLLIEVDSYTYHHGKKAAFNDHAKAKAARQAGWKLVRLSVGPKLGKRACSAVRKRRMQIFLDGVDGDEQLAHMMYEQRYGHGGN